MVMRSKQSPRCIRCRMHTESCLCPSMPRYDTTTRLVLVMHFRERAKTSATGPLLLQCLSNSALRVHGLRDRPLDLSDLFVPERRVLYLFPKDGVEVLSKETPARDPRPVTLVAPDGNWRQAARMAKRISALNEVETVRLEAGRPSAWGLRREVQKDGLSTFEAVARAFGVLESAEVQRGLEAFFNRMVEAALKYRMAVPMAPNFGKRGR
jgi:DTW domain-containing protein